MFLDRRMNKWSHNVITTMKVLNPHVTKYIHFENVYWMIDTQKHI